MLTVGKKHRGKRDESEIKPRKESYWSLLSKKQPSTPMCAHVIGYETFAPNVGWARLLCTDLAPVRRTGQRSVGSPGGISPPGSHGTEREPLGSLRSSHLSHWKVPVHCQCANSGRFLETRLSHHRFARLNGASRRYFFRAQRTR